MVDNLIALFAVVLTAITVYLLVTSVWRKRYENFRKASSTTQRVTLRGQMAERVASLFPQFVWNPSDTHFLGAPVDFVIFHGLGGSRDTGYSKPVEVVFVEAKTGDATLTKSEKLVEDAINNGRVRYEVMHLGVPDTSANSQMEP